MTRNEIFEKLESVTENMGRDELLVLIRDFANYLNVQDLKDCLECNGYVDFPDD